jgi:hypothetical protein
VVLFVKAGIEEINVGNIAIITISASLNMNISRKLNCGWKVNMMA